VRLVRAVKTCSFPAAWADKLCAVAQHNHIALTVFSIPTGQVFM